jgi:hypothetical protein
VVDNYPIKGLLIPAKAHDAGVLLGDSDGSGEVEIKDATQTQQFLAEMSVNSFCENAADVNRDGKITAKDVETVCRYVLGQIDLDEEQLRLANVWQPEVEEPCVNLRDALLIRQYLEGEDVAFYQPSPLPDPEENEENTEENEEENA